MIELHRVWKVFAVGPVKVPALSDVSFRVGKGEFVTLHGASGAGKTTLLRLLYREELPTEGEIEVLDYDVPALRVREVAELRRSIGVVFQDAKLLPGRTVYENVAFVLRVLGTPRREITPRVFDALRAVGLSSRAQAYPAQLWQGEPPAADVHALMARVQAMPDVGAVRYVSKAEALGTLTQVLGKDASVAEQLPANPLPASLEVTPTAAGATPDAARALIATLAALPEADEVGGGIDWIERLARGQRLLDVIGLGVGAVLALAAILTVTTATTLVLHARREELEIMRLVGAPELVVRAPLLLQGMLQGLVGAVMAIWVLIVLYTIAGPRLEPLVSQTLGLERLTFQRPQTVVVLMFAGTMLGGFGGWLARGRTER